MQHVLELSGPSPETAVTYLGISFTNDRDRQEYFAKELATFLGDASRANAYSGFPLGDVSAVVRFSDPPNFTLCPNPFIPEFIKRYRTADTSNENIEPFSGDLRPTGPHAIHSFHPYHTKVPPEIIRTLIEHYTKPGDLILDGFAGSGMSGVAAAEAGRNAVLCDLSPVAAFISGVNCTQHDVAAALAVLEDAVAESRKQWSYLYQTRENGREVEVNYYVWSDVSKCPNCHTEFAFFHEGVIHHGNKVETKSAFPCPNCQQELNVRRIVRVMDGGAKKKELVWVNAGTGARRLSRPPNALDLELASQIESASQPEWIPRDTINPNGYSAKLAQLGDKGVSNVSKFLSARNLTVFADLWHRIESIEEASLRTVSLATLTSIFTVISERQGYFGGGGGMSGNLYMPIVRMEKNVYDVLDRKLSKLREAEAVKGKFRGEVTVTCQSSTDLSIIPDGSVDYIYVDPPFGANIIYSEMNLLLESWLGVKTNDASEAVVDPSRERGIEDYSRLLRQCFAEFFRVLKPGRWITVEFHNTSPAVWTSIQTTLGEGGFVVAQTNILDKGSTTILGDIRPGAAKHDLLISAYKPSELVTRAFALETDVAEHVWPFLEDLLRHLPIPTSVDPRDAAVRERQKHVLFDRMVAFHVVRGLRVPLSAPDFYQQLANRFTDVDGFYLLPDQLPDYSHQRRVRENPVLDWGKVETFDEVSAIVWLQAKLGSGPAAMSEFASDFEDAASVWKPTEPRVPLMRLLAENFLPLSSDDTQQGLDPFVVKWRLPNGSESERLQADKKERLLVEFDSIRNCADGSTVGKVRTESIRVGFERAYRKGEFAQILRVADIVPYEVIHEDPTLLMYHDAAQRKTSNGG